MESRQNKYYGAKVLCNTCGDTIQSKHRHDFVACSCYEKGTGIFVDGGGEYLRMGACEGSKYTVISDGKYLIDDHESNQD